MFRKKQPPVTAPERRRSTKRVDTDLSKLSYYRSNRVLTPERPVGAQGVPERSRTLHDTPKGVLEAQRLLQRRSLVFWAFIVVMIFSGYQILLLNTSATVVVLDNKGSKITVPTERYETTFQKNMKSSVLNRSKITVDTEGIAAKLQSAHPELEKVVVTVPLFGSKSTVYVSQSSPTFILIKNNERFILSSSGFVTAQAKDTDKLPLVEDQTNETFALGTHLLPSSQVAFMYEVYYQFSQTPFSVDRFVLPAGKAYEVDLRLKDKPYAIRYNFQENAKEQSGGAIAVLEQLGAVMPNEYVDMRVPGRAYYK